MKKYYFESLEVVKRVSDREQTALTEAARKYAAMKKKSETEEFVKEWAKNEISKHRELWGEGHPTADDLPYIKISINQLKKLVENEETDPE